MVKNNCAWIIYQYFIVVHFILIIILTIMLNHKEISHIFYFIKFFMVTNKLLKVEKRRSYVKVVCCIYIIDMQA